MCTIHNTASYFHDIILILIQAFHPRFRIQCQYICNFPKWAPSLQVQQLQVVYITSTKWLNDTPTIEGGANLVDTHSTLKADKTSSLLLPTAAPALAYRRSNSNRWAEITSMCVSRLGRGIRTIQTRHWRARERTLTWREERESLKRDTNGSNIWSCSSDDVSNLPRLRAT